MQSHRDAPHRRWNAAPQSQEIGERCGPRTEVTMERARASSRPRESSAMPCANMASEWRDAREPVLTTRAMSPTTRLSADATRHARRVHSWSPDRLRLCSLWDSHLSQWVGCFGTCRKTQMPNSTHRLAHELRVPRARPELRRPPSPVRNRPMRQGVHGGFSFRRPERSTLGPNVDAAMSLEVDMLRKLLRTLFDQRAKTGLEYLPVRPIPTARPVRAHAYGRRRETPARPVGRHEWWKLRSNQLSS